MENGSREKLLEILKKFRNAMLVTQASHGTLRSPPTGSPSSPPRRS